MTDNPTFLEPTGAETQTFVAGMDRAAVIEAASNLGSSERVQFWSTFESTPEIPYPAAATGRTVDDISAVLAGSKPATLIDLDDLREPSVARLIAEEKPRFELLSESHTVDHYGVHHYFLGREENVANLAKLYQGRGGEGTPLPADEGFHRAVGEALGYSAEAIDTFIAKISSSKEHVQQKRRFGRALGWLGMKH